MKVMKEFRTSLQKLYGNNEVMPLQSTGGSSKKTRRHRPPLGKKKSRNRRNRRNKVLSQTGGGGFNPKEFPSHGAPPSVHTVTEGGAIKSEKDMEKITEKEFSLKLPALDFLSSGAPLIKVEHEGKVIEKEKMKGDFSS